MTTPKRPNILWFCTDQQRYDTIHALNNPHIHTPNLDRLMAEGVAFTRTYCQSPICTPSRASFLTGCYPSTVHGCMNGNEYWDEAAPLVTKLLKDVGYDCGLAGKFHLTGTANRREPRPEDDGYRVFHWSHDHEDRFPDHDYAQWIASQGHSLAELRKDPASIPPELHQTTWCTDRAIDFLSEQRDGPWLMSVNVFDPHGPFDPPQSYLDRYDPAALPPPLFRQSDLATQDQIPGDFQTPARPPESFNAQQIKAAYYAMIELIDDNIGRLVAALEATGQRQDTLILFTSDHGETLGDHGLLLKGCRFYEGLVRVPLIISWPGHFEAGRISDALVELTDLAPTLLDVAGQSIPAHMQGRSLLPILSSAVSPDHHRDFVRCEYYNALNAHIPGRADFEGSYATMIRDDRYKLVVYHGHNSGELYDLHEDPDEFDNRWSDPNYADVRFRLLLQSFDALAFAVDTGPAQTRAF
ncbi:sulfatase-like hydrolase/transferase [bacterium]|nr:sulfatase-like hydrolase/transferase [bacterium]